jgi:hypothetical protein
VKPNRGPCLVALVSPLGGQVLDQEQAVSLGGVQVALHHRGARRAVIDELDQDSARYADRQDRDRSALGARSGVLDGVGDDL